MDELDGLVNLVNNHKGRKNKRKGDMKSARDGAEAIREWVSLPVSQELWLLESREDVSTRCRLTL